LKLLITSNTYPIEIRIAIFSYPDEIPPATPRERILWVGIAGPESGETSSRAIATDSRRKLDEPSPANILADG